MIRLVLDIQGMSLCHFNAVRMIVAMVNAKKNPALELPAHLATLVLPRASVSSSDTSADHLKVSLDGRVRDDLYDAEYFGWDLDGCTLRVGTGATAPMRSPPQSPAVHPEPQNPDWADMRWVMEVRRFSPGSLLFPDALEASRHPQAFTRGAAIFKGGKVFGAPPQRHNKDCDHVWHFGPRHQQAVTDSLRYEISTHTAELVLEVERDGRRDTITVNADAVGHLINEATPADINEERSMSEGVSRHARGYFELFHHVLGPPEAPRKGRQFRPHDEQALVEGVFCIIMTFGAE